jgi:uncharacterized membrane protein YeaQ/YmgE (transglycosylase-associated protein family)
MQLSTMNKAIAAGIVGAVIAVLARFGFQPSGETVSALGVIVTALVGFVVSHVTVWASPANKVKQ